MLKVGCRRSLVALPRRDRAVRARLGRRRAGCCPERPRLRARLPRRHAHRHQRRHHGARAQGPAAERRRARRAIILGAAVIDDVLGPRDPGGGDRASIAAAERGRRRSSYGEHRPGSSPRRCSSSSARSSLGGAALAAALPPRRPGCGRAACSWSPASPSASCSLARRRWSGSPPSSAPSPPGSSSRRSHYRDFRSGASRQLEELVAADRRVPGARSSSSLMGMRLDLRVLRRPGVLGFAGAAHGGRRRSASRPARSACSSRGSIGSRSAIGMIPRGEVGLIFASIGAQLLSHGRARGRRRGSSRRW